MMTTIRGRLSQLSRSGGLVFVHVRIGATGLPRPETLSRQLHVEFHWSFLFATNHFLTHKFVYHPKVLGIVWEEHGRSVPTPAPLENEAVASYVGAVALAWTETFVIPFYPDLLHDQCNAHFTLNEVYWEERTIIPSEEIALLQQIATPIALQSVLWVEEEVE